jgi:hypothetical protein
VASPFGGLDLPIAEDVEINPAVRGDLCGDFGGTTNPKSTLRWKPPGHCCRARRAAPSAAHGCCRTCTSRCPGRRLFSASSTRGVVPRSTTPAIALRSGANDQAFAVVQCPLEAAGPLEPGA